MKFYPQSISCVTKQVQSTHTIPSPQQRAFKFYYPQPVPSHFAGLAVFCDAAFSPGLEKRLYVSHLTTEDPSKKAWLTGHYI